jgi:8-oxo-dGTP pyrophosphatase MutT (NUDIX family)
LALGHSTSICSKKRQTGCYYDFPIDVRTQMKPRGRYLGQRQKWFAFRFKGRDADIRLDMHTPEFVDWRWAALESAPGLVIPFKRPTYEEVAQRFAGSSAWGLPSECLPDGRRRGRPRK